MNKVLKIDSGLTSFSPCLDRFVPAGYRRYEDLTARIARAAHIRGLTAIAFDYPTQMKDPTALKKLLAECGLGIGMVEVDMYSDSRWAQGSFTSPDPALRAEALRLTREAMDVAAAIGAADVQLWLGQDGFDYPFQADYPAKWRQLIEGVGAAASYRSDVRITIEYKCKEPRSRCHIATVGSALLIANEIGLPHVGVTLDVGHALMAGENPAEAACLCQRYGRLFHLHLNDCFREWDHDLVPASVHLWETLEMFYWLRRIEWDGWYGVDIYPYREDGAAALQHTIDTIYRLHALAERLNTGQLHELQERADALAIQRLLQEQVLR
jgi:xylose isomerase